ncbi:hypothetical protein [Gordonibacter massiliensis (ex Traore et al. 2017)]|uniref:DUF3784 domain-containing protein n=1 Tax=Gordonibacter massiliensis (ex Traore et al. 2017) TaxID=1841863 RepID=A0A842JDR8_9ACTN|nr:hypothetical protein [Gordonibacter massiliensis (ex Traore et al. 2017)]MBC2890402.1 hypothetical protein [Gordonibacter massiliensis (ex Traore et al. 2017)]
MDWPLIGETVLLVTVFAVLVGYGILVFRGNERCFRLLAGSRDFLSLDPTEKEYRRTARESGVAVFLIALLLLCAWGGNLVGRLCAGTAAAVLVEAAVPLVVALSMVGLFVIVVLQMRRHVRLLNRK